ncbi:MAG: TPD domain-containing protein [Euryarchaeota archaeon]|nr:TPD domain-containing protein [Euryarchaeota archaeon]MBT3846308.1 TPD domain-containing protein [Euryarchaeota archaeon]MBT4157130.1 TPD domain-containing protein [Euryarchaeota archaeon]MBT5639336.1 TPD domain-containing protein [Euryarchaeota archaeon]MBT6076246.1 TPD domain-containing protein [Euryarchaeota archaeon]
MVRILFEVPLSEQDDGNKRQKRRPRRRRNSTKNTSVDINQGGDDEAIQRALSRFTVNPAPMGFSQDIDPPAKIVNVKWDLNAVKKSVQSKASPLVCSPGEFGFLPEERVQQIAKKIEKLDITLEQSLSLRSALNQEKSVYSHGRLMSRANELKRRYDSGESVLSLSTRFDAPPVNVFRAILTGRGWSKNKIKETLKVPSKMNERDREQFQLAESADRVSSVNQSETQNAAEVFEDILCDYFTSLNVRFRRQENLLAEQKKSEGRAIITPDLLLLDDVRINGIPCAWIDAKHFFGADLRFPKKKTQKQVDRYVNEYGQGAIVYRHGFCETLRLKGAILLDSSPLNLEALATFHESIKKKSE